MTIGRSDAKAISSANEGSPTDTRRVDRAIAASRTGIAVAPAAPPVAAAPSTSALLGGRNAGTGAVSFVCWLKAKQKQWVNICVRSRWAPGCPMRHGTEIFIVVRCKHYANVRTCCPEPL
jgi:hypothetical protein